MNPAYRHFLIYRSLAQGVPFRRVRGTSGPRDPSFDGLGGWEFRKLDEPEFLTPYRISSSNAHHESSLRDSRATQQRHRTVNIANQAWPICLMGNLDPVLNGVAPYEPPSYFARKLEPFPWKKHFLSGGMDFRRFEGNTMAWSTAERRNSRKDGQRRAHGNSGCVKQPLLRSGSCNVA